MDPTACQYAPPGQYMKDHTLLFHQGWWHLFNISGTLGYYHGYTGNEETIAWSISRDLVNWEFRGHVLHASGWPGFFDQHEVWAPFCYQGPDGFYLFYTGVVHPTRLMEYRKLGHDHPWVGAGHRETQGIARSADLTSWEKISDPHLGSGVPGRDSHVVRDDANDRWLLYSTLGIHFAHVSESRDLLHWKPLGPCAQFPPLLSSDPRLGNSARGMGHQLNTAESLTVMRHPLADCWIMLANHHYIRSTDPTHFAQHDAQLYDLNFHGRIFDLGFAGEMICHEGRWYRSGVLGPRDHWKLGFTEIAWQRDGAFRIIKPSALAGT